MPMIRAAFSWSWTAWAATKPASMRPKSPSEKIRARLERQTGGVEQRIREAITLANNAILHATEKKPEWKGMACVLTVAVIDEGRSPSVMSAIRASIAFAAARSRRLRTTILRSASARTAVQFPKREAMSHPRRNEVFRDVGSEEHAPDDPNFIEIREIPYELSCAYLLCSDGLSDAIPSREILRIVEAKAGDRWAAVRGLIAAATESGKDNVSAVLIEGEQFA